MSPEAPLLRTRDRFAEVAPCVSHAQRQLLRKQRLIVPAKHTAEGSPRVAVRFTKGCGETGGLSVVLMNW
jgi:hypothetical protein